VGKKERKKIKKVTKGGDPLTLESRGQSKKKWGKKGRVKSSGVKERPIFLRSKVRGKLEKLW